MVEFDYKDYEKHIAQDFNTKDFDFVEEGLPLPIFYGELYNKAKSKHMDSDVETEFYMAKTKKNIETKEYIPEDNKITKNNPKFNFNEKSNLSTLSDIVKKIDERLDCFIKNKTKRICYLGIPSSDKRYYNIPQSIRKLPDNSIPLVRRVTKQPVHKQQGSERQEEYEELTLGLHLENCDWEEFDYILLLDDVTTRGSSFRMVNQYLIKNGIPQEKIVNYAFYKYQNVEEWKEVKRRAEEFKLDFKAFLPIDGVVWDFDETIVNSRERDTSMERRLKGTDRKVFSKRFFEDSCLYYMYDDLDKVFEFLSIKSIPYTIVSNNYKLTKILLKQRLLREKIFPFEKKNDIIFYHRKKNAEKYYSHSEWLIKTRRKEINRNKNLYHYYTKPDYCTIIDAIEKIKIISNGNRIIGIGNTKNDIIAYKAAGLETVLVTWGIHYRFGRDYGADHVFHNPKQLLDFLKSNTVGVYPSNDSDVNVSQVAEPQGDFDDLPF